MASTLQGGSTYRSAVGESFTHDLHESSPDRSCATCNVGRTERILSAVAGGGLVAYGLKQRSLWGALLALGGGSLLYRAGTGHCHLYDQLGIDTAHGSDHVGVRAKQGHKHVAAVVIERDAAELYSYWRQLSNLPRLIEHLETVQEIDAVRSHWTARDPFGREVEWEAEIHNETPREMIAWRSLPESELDTAGSIHFKSLPHGRGTAVTLSLKYDPPAGRAGAAVARLLGNGVESELEAALRKFKQVMETGEFATVEGQPRGHC
jgi:uncharacterized membrane protein